MIRAIIFDCFGVLTADGWKEFWTALPTSELRASARELHKTYDMGKPPEAEFEKQLAELTDKPLGEITDIFNNPNPSKNVKLLSYIKTLKPDYKIGLLSNVGTPWIEDELLSPEELSLFDSLIFSYKVGMAKPDKEIYLLAAKRD